MQRTDAHTQQPTPRAQAVQAAADACNAHQAAPNTATFQAIRSAVQHALNLGASPADIRAARGQQ